MKLSLIASMLLTGCFSHAEASESPAEQGLILCPEGASLEFVRNGCLSTDGGVYELPDGAKLANLSICWQDGGIVGAWCQ